MAAPRRPGISPFDTPPIWSSRLVWPWALSLRVDRFGWFGSGNCPPRVIMPRPILWNGLGLELRSLVSLVPLPLPSVEQGPLHTCASGSKPLHLGDTGVTTTYIDIDLAGSFGFLMTSQMGTG